MRLKARLKRLAADVHWLKYDGALNVIEKQLRLMELMNGLEAAEQRQAEAAKTPNKAVARSTAPEVRVPPPPPARPEASPSPSPDSLPDPPPKPPPDPPLVLPFAPNALEHTQSMPVQWRIRGPDDYDWEEPGTNGRCLTEYDPLASEDDDD